jgi:hypothetical protein
MERILFHALSSLHLYTDFHQQNLYHYFQKKKNLLFNRAKHVEFLKFYIGERVKAHDLNIEPCHDKLPIVPST